MDDKAGEHVEENTQNDYDELVQTVCYKRTLYPESCASYLYKTLVAESDKLKNDGGLLILLPEHEKNITSIITELQTTSSLSMKELDELAGNQLKVTDFQTKCDTLMQRCRETEDILTQIKNAQHDGTTMYLK